MVKYLKSHSLVTDFTSIIHLSKLLESVISDVFLSSSICFGGICLKNSNTVIPVVLGGRKVRCISQYVAFNHKFDS